MANNEDKNVVINPTISGGKFNVETLLKEEINSTKAAKEIAGIPKRNENFAILSILFLFCNKIKC